MRAFCSANAWLDPANTITAAKAETRNRTRRVKLMTAAHRLIAELRSGTLHAASDVAGGSGPSTRCANATPLAGPPPGAMSAALGGHVFEWSLLPQRPRPLRAYRRG